MKNEFELFLHREGVQPECLVATPEETLRKLLKQDGVGIDVASFAIEVVAPDGIESPGDDDLVSPEFDATLASIGVKSGYHIFCHRCRSVAVVVHYQERTEERHFASRTRIGYVLDWALSKFPLAEGQDKKHMFLQVNGTKVGARRTQDLCEFVHEGKCHLTFDLLPDPKIQG
ncbi:MAG TPA: hypothetical protein VMJ32_14515 [Pirellulales bacterium]|nr:hypothetical protein [Pirellulales bacterium]